MAVSIRCGISSVVQCCLKDATAGRIAAAGAAAGTTWRVRIVGWLWHQCVRKEPIVPRRGDAVNSKVRAEECLVVGELIAPVHPTGRGKEQLCSANIAVEFIACVWTYLFEKSYFQRGMSVFDCIDRALDFGE